PRGRRDGRRAGDRRRAARARPRAQRLAVGRRGPADDRARVPARGRPARRPPEPKVGRRPRVADDLARVAGPHADGPRGRGPAEKWVIMSILVCPNRTFRKTTPFPSPPWLQSTPAPSPTAAPSAST